MEKDCVILKESNLEGKRKLKQEKEEIGMRCFAVPVWWWRRLLSAPPLGSAFPGVKAGYTLFAIGEGDIPSN